MLFSTVPLQWIAKGMKRYSTVEQVRGLTVHFSLIA